MKLALWRDDPRWYNAAAHQPKTKRSLLMTDKSSEVSERPRLCPTCGTRVGESASRCLVCGTELHSPGRTSGPIGPRQLTLDTRIALGLVAALALVSAGITYAATRVLGPAAAPETPTGTPTSTATASLVPSITPTSTTEPTATPLPPIDYSVAEGDTCGSVAFFFDVSVRSIIELNNLGTQCLLTIGQTILVPQPTPTASPTATSTLSPAEATEAACPKVSYTVEGGDSLFGIAQNYNVAVQAIKEYNGLTGDTVFEGQVLIIPLCERLGGPSPTPTTPAPYPAPNLLLPKDGEAFTLANDTVSLQWASVAPLREDEFYRVTVVDVTEESVGSGRKTLVDYVKDTKYIVTAEFRPSGTEPHIMRWWIEAVRLTGSSPSGESRYVSAGGASIKRVFSWSGAALDGSPAP